MPVDGDAPVEAPHPAPPVAFAVRAGDRLRVTRADGTAAVHEVAATGELTLAALGAVRVALPDGRVIEAP